MATAQSTQGSAASSISIHKTDVPVYLQVGEFYLSLSDDDPDETICVPSDTIKPTLEISTEEDLFHLLTSLRFWMVVAPHIQTLEFMLSHETNSTTTEPFEISLTYLAGFISLRNKVQSNRNSDMSTLDVALELGLIEAVKLLHQRGDPITEQACTWAAWSGDLDCLKYVIAAGAAVTQKAFRTAIAQGQLSCLKYLGSITGSEFAGSANCTIAATLGQLDCLKYLCENGEECTMQTVAGACLRGHLSILQYLSGLPNAPAIFANANADAAHGGHIECLQYLADSGYAWDAETCASAATGGHLECLKYLHERGCPWDSRTCTQAVRCDRLDCLKYAAENGCTVPSNLTRWVKPMVSSPAMQEYVFRLCFSEVS